MNSRALVAASKAVLVPRSAAIVNIARHSSAYKPPASWYPPTYNELPVPQGSWQTDYDANQRKYNKHLILGTAFFLFTMTVLKTSGLVELNASIPPLPEDMQK